MVLGTFLSLGPNLIFNWGITSLQYCRQPEGGSSDVRDTSTVEEENAEVAVEHGV